jgi:hypothetical protein
MDKVETQSSKEAAWRSRLLRHAQSGKSIAAFCLDEAVSTASFHIWRSKLAAADSHAAQPVAPAASMAHLLVAPRAPVPPPGIDVRIELGGGFVLTIPRR